MGVLKEFKEFAVKGSVIDLAVGIIIGAAFGAIVKSLVDDVIMPVVGFFLGGVDFSDRYIVLKQGTEPVAGNMTVAQAKEKGAVIVSYGQFINNIITFLIVAFVVFLLIKQINRLRRDKKTKPADPTEKTCPYCQTPVPIKATKCKFCTSDLPASTPGTPINPSL
jgi:large conductance mechanosensitive channel